MRFAFHIFVYVYVCRAWFPGSPWEKTSHTVVRARTAAQGYPLASSSYKPLARLKMSLIRRSNMSDSCARKAEDASHKLLEALGRVYSQLSDSGGKNRPAPESCEDVDGSVDSSSVRTAVGQVSIVSVPRIAWRIKARLLSVRGESQSNVDRIGRPMECSSRTSST